MFDAADGTGLDLYLAGSAPLVNMHGVQLGMNPDDPDAIEIATWSVDLRTASGRARLMTKFVGVKQ